MGSDIKNDSTEVFQPLFLNEETINPILLDNTQHLTSGEIEGDPNE